MNEIKEIYRKQAESLIPRFAKRNIEAVYCENAEDAKELVLSMIPEGSTVTSGGSRTLEETGILEELKSSRYNYIARCYSSDPKEVQARFAQQVQSDYYLLSTNAFTASGELVNIDATSNRLAMLLHGPRNVIIVAGMNKLAMTLEDACLLTTRRWLVIHLRLCCQPYLKCKKSAVRLMFAETRQPKTRGRFSIQLKFFSSIEDHFFLFKFYCSLDNCHYAQVSKRFRKKNVANR